MRIGIKESIKDEKFNNIFLNPIFIDVISYNNKN